MCGDSTVAADVERLLGGANVDPIVTDPPYSSGGFQESDRSAGSKGTAAVYKPIRNDPPQHAGLSGTYQRALWRSCPSPFPLSMCSPTGECGLTYSTWWRPAGTVSAA